MPNTTPSGTAAEPVALPLTRMTASEFVLRCIDLADRCGGGMIPHDWDAWPEDRKRLHWRRLTAWSLSLHLDGMAVGIPHGAVHRVLDELQRAGIIESVPTATDGAHGELFVIADAWRSAVRAGLPLTDEWRAIVRWYGLAGEDVYSLDEWRLPDVRAALDALDALDAVAAPPAASPLAGDPELCAGDCGELAMNCVCGPERDDRGPDAID